MAADPVTALAGLADTFINTFFESKEAKSEAKLKMYEMTQNGELARMAEANKLILAQVDVNKAEAENPNLFVSGWRPGVGWICVAGLGFNFLAQPMLAWFSTIYGWPVPPQLDISDLLTLLLGMLGLGGMRSFEKVKGVAK